MRLAVIKSKQQQNAMRSTGRGQPKCSQECTEYSRNTQTEARVLQSSIISNRYKLIKHGLVLAVLREFPDLRVEARCVALDLFFRRCGFVLRGEPSGNIANDLSEQLFRYSQVVACFWVHEVVLQELLDLRSRRWIPIETALECLLEFRWNFDVANACSRVLDLDLWINDRHDAMDRIADVRKGRLSIYHLVQNASKTPNVTRLPKFHQLAHADLNIAS